MLDLIMPNRRTERGNIYGLVIVDTFTRFTTVIPIPDKRGETITNALWYGWVQTFGCPDTIQVDDASELTEGVSSE